MRKNRDGSIQCRRLHVSLPVSSYRRALAMYPYRMEGIVAEVQENLGIALTGVESFRIIGQRNNHAILQIDSNWVQPTKA